MNKFERKVGRRLWYCGSLGTLLFLTACAALPQSGVEVAFDLPETTVTANEPVYVRLSIRNSLEEEVGFVPADYSESYFDLFVTEPGGRMLQADTMAKGGLRHVGRISVPGRQSYAQKLLVSQSYQFTKPGDYKLKFQPSGPVRTASGETIPFNSEELTLTVEPRDPERLQRICQSLSDIATGPTRFDTFREAALALSFVRDPVAVPYLGRVLAKHKYITDFEVKGLVRIGGPEALEVLKSNLASANPNLRTIIQGGIEAIESGPHGHTPN